MRYRKKPVEIEAKKYDGDFMELLSWSGCCSDGNGTSIVFDSVEGLYINTLEGKMKVPIGNFVICGVNGEFYSCDPEIFDKTYELVE